MSAVVNLENKAKCSENIDTTSQDFASLNARYPDDPRFLNALTYCILHYNIFDDFKA